MIVLEGAPALSAFRRERLQARLQSIHPAVRLLGAWPVYWVDPEAGATPDDATLRRILQASPDAAPRADGAVSRYVTPRLGTLSPWASKATELLHGARLPVHRVERGLHVVLTLRDLCAVVPARWQENIKNGATASWAEFRDEIAESPTKLRRMTRATNTLEVWASALPPERVHVVTVPSAGPSVASCSRSRRSARSLAFASSITSNARVSRMPVSPTRCRWDRSA